MFEIALIITLVCCTFMAGLTTFVHFVHYPGFRFAEAERWAEFHAFHTSRTGGVVGFPMLLELASGVALFAFAGDGLLFWLTAAAGLLLALVWAETALRVVPVHNKLVRAGKAEVPELTDKLVKSNRNRTIFWNMRVLVLIYMVIFLLY